MIGTVKERRAELRENYAPWEEMNVWGRFSENVKKYRNTVYVISDGNPYTYGEVNEMVDRTAYAFYRAGMRKGDHVAICMSNRIEYVVLIYAMAKIGAVKVPVNTGVKPRELSYYLQITDARWFVTDKMAVAENMEETSIQKIILSDEEIPESVGGISWNVLFQIEENEEEKTNLERWAVQNARNGEELSDIMFTSGSSKQPKAIQIHHDMLLRSAYGTCYTRCMETGRRIYLPIPFYHMFAYVEGLLACMMVGGTVVISTEKFNAKKALKLLREYQVNDIVCVSYIMMKLLGEEIRPEDYPDMHACYFASSCPSSTWQRARDAFGINDVSTGYGMSECGSTTTMIAPDDPPGKVENCHGKIKKVGIHQEIDGDELLLSVKIIDRTTKETLSEGEVGEICCKGVTVTKGYYHNEDANHHSFDVDGWFHTGDQGCIDQDGYLKYMGRCDDIYKINGENVSPFYLDGVIDQCEYVKAVETVGVASQKYGAVGVAFVEVEEETEEVRQKIVSYCETHLMHFQVPKYIIFSKHDEWPLTNTGKIKKKGLREIAEKKLANLI